MGTQVSLGANPSPLQDFVNFSGGLASKQRGCVTRRVEIRHGGNGALITRVSPEAPLRSGKLFSAFYDTKFFALNGDFVNGEKVRASVDQTKLKKGGRVIASCKAASKTATVLLSEG
ncbi:MAG: hypothetical protein EXQ70_04515 [Solirubrobacterales bacterium]|nr:hypothetical protein [Solirubrobacterales bacterium]